MAHPRRSPEEIERGLTAHRESSEIFERLLHNEATATEYTDALKDEAKRYRRGRLTWFRAYQDEVERRR